MTEPRGDEVYDTPSQDRPYSPAPSTGASGPGHSDVAEVVSGGTALDLEGGELAGSSGLTTSLGAEAVDDAVDADPGVLPEFDQRVRLEFDGLLYLGALERQFTWLGHTFVIRTLNSADLIEVALLVKDYQGSDGHLRAYQGAVAAACVRQVDGKPIPVIPISDTDSALRERFNWILRHWFPPTLDQIYQEYILLETRAREVIEAMGKASGSVR